jgi:hypothetical protein
MSGEPYHRENAKEVRVLSRTLTLTPAREEITEHHPGGPATGNHTVHRIHGQLHPRAALRAPSGSGMQEIYVALSRLSNGSRYSAVNSPAGLVGKGWDRFARRSRRSGFFQAGR